MSTLGEMLALQARALYHPSSRPSPSDTAVAVMPRTWKPVELEEHLTFKGGLADSVYPVKSRICKCANHGDVHFVHIAKGQEWIMQAVLGKSERASLKRSTLIQTLKDKLQATVRDTPIAGVAAAADAAVAADAVDDPMAFLDDIAEVTPTKPRKRAYTSMRGNNNATLVTMPAKEPNKHPRRTETRDVLLMPLSTNALWIRKDDVPWMIEYLADEVGPSGSQGVPLIDDQDEDEPNCKAAGVYMEWDFDDTVTAKWVSGPSAGKVVRSLISAFTAEKWAAMDAIHNYGVPYDNANREQLKQAVWDFVENHCVQLAARAGSSS